MSNNKETFWSKVPTEEKPGLVTFFVIVSAILIFSCGVVVGKHIF